MDNKLFNEIGFVLFLIIISLLIIPVIIGAIIGLLIGLTGLTYYGGIIISALVLWFVVGMIYTLWLQ